MEKKITKEPVYETQKVKTGEKEKITFIANDGKEFASQEQCEDYENKLTAIKDGESQFRELSLSGDEERAIIGLCFETYDTSSIDIIVWKASKDESEIKKAVNYLLVKGFSSKCYTGLGDLKEGVDYLICDWIEGENGDYPSYYGKVMPLSDAQRLFINLAAKII